LIARREAVFDRFDAAFYRARFAIVRGEPGFARLELAFA
jgi:hypothetical protein